VLHFVKCGAFLQVVRSLLNVAHLSKCGVFFKVCRFFLSLAHFSKFAAFFFKWGAFLKECRILLSAAHFCKCAAFVTCHAKTSLTHIRETVKTNGWRTADERMGNGCSSRSRRF